MDEITGLPVVVIGQNNKQITSTKANLFFYLIGWNLTTILVSLYVCMYPVINLKHHVYFPKSCINLDIKLFKRAQQNPSRCESYFFLF